MNIGEVGEIIRRRRKALGVNQDAVAELAGISVHTLSNIESGRGNPTLEVLSRVLDVLGLELVVQPSSPNPNTESGS
jgi:transcriptional regulator with XRE-family HTH domain